jgi:hypothetical protein
LKNATLEMLELQKNYNWQRQYNNCKWCEADMIKNRVNQSRSNGNYNSDYDKEKLQERLQLAGGTPFICYSIWSRNEREKDRVDDALRNSTPQLKKEL